jgi:C-terminal processing protease CtpA/Prc
MMRKLLLLLLPLFFLAGPGWGANSAKEFGGVGIDGVPRADGSIVVRQLVLGGPAQLAGVKAGDVITRIDGKATLGSDFKDMVEHRLRGRAGTEVSIQVRRSGSAKPLTFKLVRRQLALGGAGVGKKEQPKGE